MHALLIEDSEIFAEALRRILASARAEIQLNHVCCLADAAKFRESQLDVILLDLTLPDTEGLDSVRGAQAALPGVPLVVLTADHDAERAIEILRGGAQDYLVKGAFDADTLLRSVRYAVERAQSEQLRRRLLQADRLAAIGKLAAGVVHEISNPAAYVRASQELVRAHMRAAERALETALHACSMLSGPPPELRSALTGARAELDEVTRIQDQTALGMARICSVVSDLRGYARLEPGEVVEVHPNLVIEEVCQLVYRLVRHKARLVKDLQEVPPVALVPGRLDQILTNLLVNAAQAVTDGYPQREQITVSTRARDGQVVIAVTDTGVGMTEEEQRRAFEPFFSTKARGEGMGLGLSICADIVSAHGGKITCSSTPGWGARFEVSFPAATSLAAAAAAVAPPAPVIASQRARVLLIDDEIYLRQTYALLLNTEFEMLTAADGTEALECLDTNPDLDLVICDVMMPDMDAAELLAEVRAKHPELLSRFILHTGGAMNERTRRLVDSGEFKVFYKPVAVAEISAAIRGLTGQARSEAVQSVEERR